MKKLIFVILTLLFQISMQGQSQIPGLGICTVEITTTTIAETAENMPFNVFHDITGLTQGLGFSWVELT